MRRRIGVKKALVGGALLVVVGLLLMAASGVPPFPGRHPDSSSPDPTGLPPMGPLTDLSAIQGFASPPDLESNDLSTPPVIAVVNDPAYFAALNGLDSDAELTRDFTPAGPTDTRQEALAALVLAATVLQASRAQTRDRRLRAENPASAA